MPCGAPQCATTWLHVGTLHLQQLGFAMKWPGRGPASPGALGRMLDLGVQVLEIKDGVVSGPPPPAGRASGQRSTQQRRRQRQQARSAAGKGEEGGKVAGWAVAKALGAGRLTGVHAEGVHSVTCSLLDLALSIMDMDLPQLEEGE